ncbi:MAG TPA: hypothetical protein VFM18_16425 [Methanosarcina sp.]|nr:hypothetical protein [Methanosarcina sp.]
MTEKELVIHAGRLIGFPDEWWGGNGYYVPDQFTYRPWNPYTDTQDAIMLFQILWDSDDYVFVTQVGNVAEFMRTHSEQTNKTLREEMLKFLPTLDIKKVE